MHNPNPGTPTATLRMALLTLALTLAGCDFEEPKEPTLTASISGLNHTDTYVASFYVNGAWGANIGAGEGGGKFTCCVVLPKTYRPGLTATVKWSATNTREDHWREKTVPIDAYSPDGGDLHVHFLPGDQIRLVVSNYAPWHPDYPGPGMPNGYKLPRQQKK